MRLFFLIFLSFFIAFVLKIVPLPFWASWFRPAFVELVLIFWLLNQDPTVGIACAFFTGLFLDMLMDTRFGLHAMIFVMIAYIVLKLHTYIRLLSWWKKNLFISILTLCYQTSLMWLHVLLGHPNPPAWFLCPVLTSALIWPFVDVSLRKYVELCKI